MVELRVYLLLACGSLLVPKSTQPQVNSLDIIRVRVRIRARARVRIRVRFKVRA